MLFKDIIIPLIGYIITAIGLIVAYKESKLWWNKIIWQKKYDLSLEALAFFYTIESRFMELRAVHNSYYPLEVKARFEAVKPDFDRLFDVLFQFSSHYGRQYEPIFHDMIIKRNKVQYAYHR